MSIRVLLADDQEMIRTGLRMILNAQDGIEVVGEAADGSEAVALARRLRPDVGASLERPAEVSALGGIRNPQPSDPSSSLGRLPDAVP